MYDLSSLHLILHLILMITSSQRQDTEKLGEKSNENHKKQKRKEGRNKQLSKQQLQAARRLALWVGLSYSLSLQGALQEMPTFTTSQCQNLAWFFWYGNGSSFKGGSLGSKQVRSPFAYHQALKNLQ